MLFFVVMNAAAQSDLIKHLASKTGFDFCGISKAEFLETDAPKLEAWLKNDFHGKMKYMENHFDKRLDPRKLVPGAKSVISLMCNYFPSEKLNDNSPLISKYAYGSDYHVVIKEKLRTLVAELQSAIGNFSSRIFVDSAPVLERSWAMKSGLGWVGKNSNLINKKQGSYFFLAEIICDLELIADVPTTDHCGTCTRCIDACPTEAIHQGKEIDGSKCISYFTIELKEQTPDEMKGKWTEWVFGCDVCQNVCPWNRFSKPTTENLFQPTTLNQFSKSDWIEMTEEIFQKNFGNTPMARTGLEKIKSNIRFIIH